MADEENNNHFPRTEKPGAVAAPFEHNIPISGRFDQYRSSFWAAALAILGARYAPRPFLKALSWDTHGSQNFYLKHMYSAAAGTAMEGVTAYFAHHTWKDMHSIFSQVLAWEFDKDPKDIGYADFKKSKNTMVQQTLGNYVDRNVKRFGVNLFFFSPYIFGPIFKKLNILKGQWHPDNWKSENGADLGLGALSAYLFSDVLSRKMSPFEALQNVIDRKINQTDNPGDVIEIIDLFDIYERNVAKDSIGSFLKHRGTPEWDHAMTIFSRMTDLMNQTYKNVAPKEKANFGMPQFIYMTGNNLINSEKVEQTLAYIEVANHYGIPALKEVVKQVDSGMELSQALKPYPEALPVKEPPLGYATPVGGEFPKTAARQEIMPKRAIQPVSLIDQASRAEINTGITH